MTVNAFMLDPIAKLSRHYRIRVVVNGDAKQIDRSRGIAEVIPVRIERRISPLRDLLALVALFRIFRRHRFAAVQSVTPKAGLLAMLAAFLAGIRMRTHIFTGQVWVTRRGLSRWIFKRMDRLIALLATEVLVDSVSQRRFLLDQRIVDRDRSQVLAKGSICGVDTARFKPDDDARKKLRQALGIEADDFVFLFIGRLNRDKGVLDLAQAFVEIDSPRAVLLVVGPDEAGMRVEMERRLSARSGQVHFVGYSDFPESYMAAADALCLPSYREGFGSVVLEAAAVGIPAIGSRIYGVEDAIDEDRSGLLFPAGDVGALREQMLRLMNDPKLSARLGAYARERAVRDFGSEVVATAWLEYYRARI